MHCNAAWRIALVPGMASTGAFGQDAGAAVVLAQEQVRVQGIEVEWRALGNELVDRGAVLAAGLTQQMRFAARRRRHGT
jgi:hypothetical protein